MIVLHLICVSHDIVVRVSTAAPAIHDLVYRCLTCSPYGICVSMYIALYNSRTEDYIDETRRDCTTSKSPAGTLWIASTCAAALKDTDEKKFTPFKQALKCNVDSLKDKPQSLCMKIIAYVLHIISVCYVRCHLTRCDD